MFVSVEEVGVMTFDADICVTNVVAVVVGESDHML